MTTPTIDDATKRRALRRRHLVQRQTIIFGTMLVVLVALVLAGLGVFLNVLPPPFDPDFTDLKTETDTGEIVPCPADGALPVALSTIQANVYNGTSVGGLAATTAESLRSVGVVTVAETNYPMGTYDGATLVVTGIDGIANAYTTAALFPGTVIRFDATRTDATIDVVLGAKYTGMNGAALDPSVPLVAIEGCTPFAQLPVHRLPDLTDLLDLTDPRGAMSNQPYNPYGSPDSADTSPYSAPAQPSPYSQVPQPSSSPSTPSYGVGRPQDAPVDANPYGTPAPTHLTGPAPMSNYQGAPYALAPAVTTNQMAILSIVLSGLGFITAITAIAGVVCGHIALMQLKADPRQQGRGLAIAGLILGYVMIAVIVLAIIGFAMLVANTSSRGY